MMTGDSLVIGKAANPEMAVVGYPYEYLQAGMGGEQGPTAWRYPGVLIPTAAMDELKESKKKKGLKREAERFFYTVPIGAMIANRRMMGF